MDEYVKGETLGEGSFGVVFRAVHKQVHGHDISHHTSILAAMVLCCGRTQLRCMLGDHRLESRPLKTPTFADRGSGGHQENQARQGKGGSIPIHFVHLCRWQHEHEHKHE